MLETWKPIFDGRYEVSDQGRIKHTATGKLLAGYTRSNGYVEVCLSLPGKGYTVKLHRLVMEAFVGPRPAGMHANHIDGNKRNNALSNLEYCTPNENMKHSYRIGIRSKSGERHHRAKFRDTDIKEIRKLCRDGVKYAEIASRYQITKQYVSAIKCGRAWGHII